VVNGKFCIVLLFFAGLAPTPSVAVVTWSTQGVPVCVQAGAQLQPSVDLDQRGRPVFFWDDQRTGHNQIFGCRFGLGGQPDPNWPADGMVVATSPLQGPNGLLADGAGGFYISSTPISAGWDVYVQHVGPEGSPAPGWTLAGIPLATGSGDQDLPTMALDDSGGVFVLWEDLGSYVIKGVRLHADGTVAAGWAAGGKTLSSAGNPAVGPFITSDGAGGFDGIWTEQHPPATGSYVRSYAFRYRSDGTLYPGWPALGVPLTQTQVRMQEARIASDGAGGLIAAWADYRSAPASAQPYNDLQYWDIYAQHVLAVGTIAPGWPADAKPLCTVGNTQWYPTIVADGQGGAIVEWQDFRNNNEDVFAARIRGDGTFASGWIAGGNPVIASTSADLSQHLVADGSGGMYSGVDDASLRRSYVQHLMGDGTPDPQFGTRGLPVSTQPSDESDVNVASDGAGGVYAVWIDNRGGTDPSNIWANHFGPDIATAIAITLMSSDLQPDQVRLTWQAPKTLRATVERHEMGGNWQTLGEVATDGQDRFSYADHSVTPGTSYGYRLSYSEGTSIEHSAETTVLVPLAYTLALAGFRPNPVAGADLSIAFELPNTAPGTLELLDVIGRRIASRDLSGYGAGRYTERMGEGARVPAGMYWVRLSHGGRVLTARGVVLK
jgi:hypothetical protein